MNHFRNLRADEIECRISTCNEKGISLLLYKDARVDMRLLDETVGSMNWKRSHQVIDGNLYCTIEVWDAEKQQWISKQDVGTESYTEKEKGQASDSFKRAGFNFGIGRELYTAPFVWVKSSDCEIKTGNNGKPTCYDRFKVERIDIEDGVITALDIRNSSNGKLVFSFRKQSETATAKKRKSETASPETISGEMFTVLQNLCKQKKKDLKSIMKHYGAEKPSELLVKDWKAAVEMLKGLPDAS